jgi:hypothetical protein
MGVNLGRGDIRMTQQFLDGTQVVTPFQQTGREAVAECVRCHALVQRDLFGRFFYSFTNTGRMQMMPPKNAGRRVHCKNFLTETKTASQFPDRHVAISARGRAGYKHHRSPVPDQPDGVAIHAQPVGQVHP